MAADDRLEREARGLSIRDFITDGSLSALCEELTLLSGVRVRLLDEARRPVGVATEGPHEDALGVDDAPSTLFPIVASGRTLGWLELGDGQPRLVGHAGHEHPEDSREALAHTLRLIGSTAGEFCSHELELRHRVRELGALYKLTSHLARATNLEQTLSIALDSAVEMLGLDAGTIALFGAEDLARSPDHEGAVVHKASRGLSRDWLSSPLPLSKGREFDRLGAQGLVVVSDEIAADPRVLIHERARAEGLRSFIGAGLVFQSRLIGVMRLYSRSPRAFTDDDRRVLRSIADQSAVAVEQARLLALQAEERRHQRQLQLAGDVQRRMLPERLPALPGLDAAARYVPSLELGGDFYDAIELAGHLGVAVGDVVGKGVPAALLMAAVRSSLRAHAQQLYHLDEVIARVNRDLARDTKHHEFASLWYGVIDPRSLRLTYCSAGHDPPILVRADARVESLSIGGMLVGIDAEQRYERAVCQLRKGDTLVAYTDGLPDTLDFESRKFGRQRLIDSVVEVLERDPKCSASNVVEHVFWTLRQFAGLAPRSDDQTLVIVRVSA